MVLTWFFATYAGRVSSNTSSCPFGQPSMALECFPTVSVFNADTRNFGIVLEPRYIVGTGRLDQ
jgi:hypothetical protein